MYFVLVLLLYIIIIIEIVVVAAAVVVVGRDSSTGIATRFGLDGPGIEFRWGRHFLLSSKPAPGPTQPPIQ